MRKFFVLIVIIAVFTGISCAEIGTWWGEEGEAPFKEATDSPVFASFPGGLVIDWQRKTAIISGRSSVSGPMTLENRGKIMKLAVDQALNSLIDQIGLVRIDGFTKISDITDNNFVLRDKIGGLIGKSYRIVHEKVYTAEGIIEITLEFDLAGKKGLGGTLFPVYLGQLFSSASPLPPPIVTTEASSSEYTGLIIDASNLGIEGGIAPRIVSEDGSEIYSLRKGVDKSALINYGTVDYALAASQTSDEVSRAGDNPLTVSALRKLPATYNCDIVIASTEAERIRKADVTGNFLRELKVVILL